MDGRHEAREVFVISDLHLGGAPPQEGTNSSRGFRLMTHPEVLAEFLRELAWRPSEVELVINGDFVDFLAEEHVGEERWIPFVADEQRAVYLLRRIVERNLVVFAALEEFVARGNRLTILLGNHDLELSLPAVRAELEQVIGGGRGGCRFIYDGEAYAVGDVLIEHGNRYDPVNMVDFDGLRQVRSLLSRRSEHKAPNFLPPLGSCLVSSLLNPLKEEFPFIDLLKPESEGLIAVLLALDPAVRMRLPGLLRTAWKVPTGDVRGDLPMFGKNIASTPASRRRTEAVQDQPSMQRLESGLLDLLQPCLGDEATDFLAMLDEVDNEAVDKQPGVFFGRDVASKTLDSRLGLLRLALQRTNSDWRKRVALVRRALRAVNEDRSFEDGFETGRRYLAAAEALSKSHHGSPKFRFILFGHTHHRKQLRLNSGADYINTGTWAEMMRFPAGVTNDDDEVAGPALIRFLEDLDHGRLGAYLEFRPTFARIRLRASGECDAELHDYSGRGTVAS